MESLIRAKTLRFRWALDRVSPETWSRCEVSAFPRGACAQCAELLARYLKEKLGIEVTYASGDVDHLVDNGDSHAWLEYEGLFLDISADQFGLPAVIVARDSAFHINARNIDRHPMFEEPIWFSQYAAPVWNEANSLINKGEKNGTFLEQEHKKHAAFLSERQ